MTILRLAPRLMKGLSVAGTAAMFLVGGGILAHGIPVVGHWIEATALQAGALPAVGGLLETAGPMLMNAAVGVVAGVVAVAVAGLAQRLAWP